VLKASKKFVRLIVRRPHAYEFKNKDKSVPIPGIVFLDAQRKVVGTAQLHSAKQLVEKVNELTKSRCEKPVVAERQGSQGTSLVADFVFISGCSRFLRRGQRNPPPHFVGRRTFIMER
jgi:hypothetical protein